MIATVVLVMQLVTGIFLTMNYKPAADDAFASVEYIMRDVDWGWLIRYLHSTGASAFFIVVYLHMFRGLLYGSYKKPRELVWIIGMFIYLCLMAEAFFGYLLPWGNMSYWGAQVIVSLFGAIPVIGNGLVGVDSRRLLHLRHHAQPLLRVPRDRGAAGARAARGRAHRGAARRRLEQPGRHRDQGAQGPERHPIDGIPFHPYHTVKDLVGIVVFLDRVRVVVFFAPDMGGYFLEHANFEPADPLKTPEHIAPVWYFTPFYAMLRAVPDQAARRRVHGRRRSLLPFFLPWLDRCRVKSIRYRGWSYKVALAVFVVSFLSLGYLGMQQPTGPVVVLCRIFTILYFAFFFSMPFYSRSREDEARADEGDAVKTLRSLLFSSG